MIHAVEGYFEQGQGFHGIDAEQFARWHWWWTFFLYTGARASSACTATVNDIYLDRRGHHQLTLTVKGAGVRRKNVPWIPALERVYQHYRQTVGLPAIALNTRLTRREVTDPLPMGAGPRHLLFPVQWPRGDSTPLSYSGVHKWRSNCSKKIFASRKRRWPKRWLC